jgi:glycosyltransferase involved in cell wall biosynthesis
VLLPTRRLTRPSVSFAPTVTVVIPTRDRWSLLCRHALRSALGQQGPEVEVVVVDDGSEDGTPDRLADVQDPRLLVVRHERPRGVSEARNAGVRAAHGEWVAFLDDDDLWSPDKLRRQLEAARTSGSDFAYAGAVWVDEELHVLNGHTPPDPLTLAGAVLRWNVVWGGCSNVVARRDLVLEVGGFDEELFQLGDWDLWIRLALAGNGACVDDVLVALVVHRQSMLLVDRRDVFLEFDRLRAKHSEASARFAGGPDPVLFARWVGAGHLRSGRRGAAAKAYLRGTRNPGNVVRAAGAILGPSTMRAGRRLLARAPRRRVEHEARVEPAWLDAYR